MTRKLHSAGMVLVVVLSTVVGGIAIGGTAVALEGSAGATYPLTPGSDTLGTFVFVARPGDNIEQNGIKRITLDFGSDASVANVSDDDVFISVRGGQRIEVAEEPSRITDVTNISVSTNRAENRLTITLPEPVRPRIPPGGVGAEIAIKVENFTTPSQPGTYSVQGTFADPSGSTDGPASVSYSVSSPTLSMSNQSISQFTSTQTLDVSASVPGGGYVGLFTVGQNGSPNRLVGWTNVSTAPSTGNYTIDVSGNVSESQRLVAVAYTESEGRSAGLRAQQSFDPAQDERLVVNGQVVNATAFVSTPDIDSRVTAGSEYDQGARLYFARGEPNTAYQVRTIQNGELGPAATQFQTAANGTAVIDTTGLSEGQYAITRVADNSLVSLDNDSTTSPQDDSFLITAQQAQTTTAGETGGTTEAGTETGAPATDGAPTDAAGGGATETPGGGSGGAGGAGGGGGADGGGSGGSNGTDAGGPGFGVVAAVVALLGAALLATRRR